MYFFIFQPSAIQSLLKQQNHPPDILSNLLSNPSPAAAAAAAAATISQQQPQAVGEVAQRLAAVFQATIAAQQAAAAANQAKDEDQPENLSSSSPKKHCPSALSPSNNNNNNNNNTSTFVEPNSTMKVPPISLPNGHGQLPMPFSTDFLWRFPNPYLPPPSPLDSQMKSQLPGGLGHDPRCWTREDVIVFLRYCEREYDLDKIDLDKFQMNGKLIQLS